MYNSIEKYKVVVDDLNSLLKQVEQLWHVSLNSKHELLDGMLFCRVRDGYASVILLIVSDFHLEAGILARSTVEAFLVFAGHMADREITYDYLVKQDKYNKKKIVNKTLQNGKYQEHKGIVESLDLSVFNEAKDIKAYEWAKLAGQNDHYDYSYTFMSNYTHVNLDSLEKRLDADGEKIIGFKQLQDDYDLDLILTTVIDIVVQTIQMLKRQYIVLEGIQIEDIAERFYIIANEGEQ